MIKWEEQKRLVVQEDSDQDTEGELRLCWKKSRENRGLYMFAPHVRGSR